MLDRIFVRESEDFEYSRKHDRIKIGVIGMAHGAGASMVATALAKELTKAKGKRVAFVEGMKVVKGEIQLYDSLGMDKRFLGKTYINFFDEIMRGVSINGKVNLDERINWALWVPKGMMRNVEAACAVSSFKFVSLINNIVADVVVCDLNDYAEDEDVLSEMDMVVFVIDPLPSRLIAGYEKLCTIKKIRMFDKKIIFVLNKENEGINKSELFECLRLKPDFSLPLLPSEAIYEAEYNCRIPYSGKLVNSLISESIGNLAKALTS